MKKQPTQRSAPRRAIRENDELIDAAAGAAPAPQQVPVPEQAAPAAVDPATQQPGPMNPLVPPQPGMIPTGWMFPNQSAQAVAMDTGDVNLAAAAPGGGVVGEAPVTNEEAQMIEAFRKYKKQKRLERLAARLSRRVKENSEEELEPELPEDVQLDMPPAEGELAVEDDFEDAPEGDGYEEDSAIVTADDLEDIVVDINKLFADAGGDLDAVMDEEEAEEAGEEYDEEYSEEPAEENEFEDDEEGDSEEPGPVQEARRTKENKLVDQLSEEELDLGPEGIAGDEDFDFDDLLEDSAAENEDAYFADRFEKGGLAAEGADVSPEDLADFEADDMLYEKKSRRREAVPQSNAMNIRFPAGTPAPKVSPDAVGAVYDALSTEVPEGPVQAFEKRAATRRAVLAELRRQRQRRTEGLADADLSDADKTQEEVIDEIIPGSNKSAILESKGFKPSEKFLERYREKQQLDYRAMLEQGLLG